MNRCNLSDHEEALGSRLSKRNKYPPFKLFVGLLEVVPWPQPSCLVLWTLAYAVMVEGGRVGAGRKLDRHPLAQALRIDEV